MSIEVPPMNELLQFASDGKYGDDIPAAQGGGNAGDTTIQRGGALHLSSILPAVSASLGSPVETAIHHDPRALQHALGLPQARSAIVVLVDGMGYWNLNMRLGHAPYLRSLMNDSVNQRPIATCSPSTTVAAMGTFGTGTCPGLTGMAGYTQRNPQTGALSQLIQFRDAMDPHELQQQPTVFETLHARGMRITSSGLPKFAHSPLTEAALRGSDYHGHTQPKDRIAAACKAASADGLTYVYLRDLDKVGHAYGWDSDQWIGTFERLDGQLAMLRRNAPKDTLIVIMADHGMISADPEQRIDIALDPRLTEGVAMVGGEPRSLMLYAQPDANVDDIVCRWRSVLEDRALVRTRDEVFAQGVLGPVRDDVIPMIGDIIVSAAQSVTLVDSRIQKDQATRLPSVHGSLSRLEADIPCLVDVA